MNEDKLRIKLRKLMARLGDKNEFERENARGKIDEILLKRRMSWNDLMLFVLTPSASSASPPPPSFTPDPADDADAVAANAANLILDVLQSYLDLQPYEFVAITLWILHTHVFRKFTHSPRLLAVSPVMECGKSTLLKVLEQLVANGSREVGMTAPAAFRLIDSESPCLLIDEADNADLGFNGTFRTVLNQGHEPGSSIPRVIRGETKRFRIFAPIAIAAIGMLYLTLQSRSLIIHMCRTTKKLRRFDQSDTRELSTAYCATLAWARDVQLNTDPEMPDTLTNRQRDNWRPLLSCASAFGPEWVQHARDAAAWFAKRQPDEDAKVRLLRDIRSVFNACHADRISSKALAAELAALDDRPWSEWRGIENDQQPRALTQGALAGLLHPFRIYPRSVWSLPHTKDARSAKGYLRAWFETVWDSYCREEDGNPASAGSVTHLRGA